jgi:MFS family permease
LSVGYFGQQSWSTLVMVLPTDLFPKRAVGTVAGLVGLGGAMGGVVLGQFSSYLLDHNFGYKPVMLVAGLLHVTAFCLILLTVPNLRPLVLATKARARDTLLLVLKLQLPAIGLMLLGLTVVQTVMATYVPKPPATMPATTMAATTAAATTNAVATTTATTTSAATVWPNPVDYTPVIAGAAALFVIELVLLLIVSKGAGLMGAAVASAVIAVAAGAAKIYFVAHSEMWDAHHAFASCCVALSILADFMLFVSAVAFVIKRSGPGDVEMEVKVPA